MHLSIMGEIFNRGSRIPAPEADINKLLNRIEAELRRGRFSSCPSIPSESFMEDYPLNLQRKANWLRTRCERRKRLWPKWMLGNPLYSFPAILIIGLIANFLVDWSDVLSKIGVLISRLS